MAPTLSSIHSTAPKLSSIHGTFGNFFRCIPTTKKKCIADTFGAQV